MYHFKRLMLQSHVYKPRDPYTNLSERLVGLALDRGHSNELEAGFEWRQVQGVSKLTQFYKCLM